MKTTHLLAIFSCWGPALLVAATADATTSAKSRVARIELLESGVSKTPKTVLLDIALAEDDRPSIVEVHDDRASYSIDIRRKHLKDNSAVIHLNLNRNERIDGRQKKARARTARLSVSSRVTLGRQALLGRIARDGAGEIRVSVMLK